MFGFATTPHGADFSLVAITKTMDNDMRQGVLRMVFNGDHACKGTGDAQRTMLGSHARIGMFRIFGRDAGFTALRIAARTCG